jgi:hypothetical protein
VQAGSRAVGVATDFPNQQSIRSIMYRSERLAKLLKTPVIMDVIMGQLSPLSAQNLLEAISIDVETDDRTTSKYKSIFKFIIPNRGWLMRKVREDHVFTIITQDANRLMDLPCHAQHKDGTETTLRLILFVTRDHQFIPCTTAFMPTDLFLDGPRCAHLVNDMVDNKSHPKTRTIIMRLDGVTIIVQMLLSGTSVHIPVYLDSETFGDIMSRDDTSAEECATAPSYAHAEKSRCRILHETETLELDSCMLKDTVNYSFAIHLPRTVTSSENPKEWQSGNTCSTAFLHKTDS